MPIDVPYMSRDAIEAEANLLLDEFGDRHRVVAEPPVPIDDIVELHLELTFEIRDLRALFGVGDVHGAIWFRERRIAIDRQLDPVVNPAKRGRYNFTLAHEAGHWRLHRKHFLRREVEIDLFGGSQSPPDHICRSTEKKRPVEWQADNFAAQLLMPRKMVRRAWEQWHGGQDAVALCDLGEEGRERLTAEIARRGGAKTGKNAETEMIFEHYCRPLAERFQVSAEAMRIRLEEMGLLLRAREAQLF